MSTTTSLVPECIPTIGRAVNELATTAEVTFRAMRKAAEGLERTVEGVDEIATLMLAQQHQRIMAELESA